MSRLKKGGMPKRKMEDTEKRGRREGEEGGHHPMFRVKLVKSECIYYIEDPGGGGSGYMM